MRAGPFDDTPPPPDLVALGASLEPVWRNELGGLTFRGRIGAESVFVKWAPTGLGLDLAAERDRMLWAIAYSPVPVVLDYRESADGEVLVTRAIPAESAVSERWLADPDGAVRGLAVGLRRWHDALPPADCPFDWSPAARIAGLPGLADLASSPPIDRLVVGHGDPCAPNTLLSDDGDAVAHVDLQSLGVADRWADIAVAARNTALNYGPGREGAFLEAYGVDPDPDRQRYYLELWDRT
jgi:kanamycin kinase